MQGTLRLTSAVPRTYFLDYDTAYGNAPLAHGQIRVDVRAPRQVDERPVAMPDTATLHGQAPALVDVLANDVDPGGGMLTVRGADARAGDQLDVAVVDGRWLRLAGRCMAIIATPHMAPHTIRSMGSPMNFPTMPTTPTLTT